MAMRLSGLMSGMDTDSVVQELVAARRTKVDNAKKAQTKLSWQQDAWKELNTKLKNLQSKYVNNMRFSTAYSKKTTKVSNSSVVSVITGENAVNGVQSLQVKSLAKTAYLTGAEVKGADGADVTALTKISDLVYGKDSDQKFSGSSVITLTTGGKTTDIEITESTTISDFLNKVKEAGLNANFDANNQRFFISAKESGEENDFSFTASDANGIDALNALGVLVPSEATMELYEKYSNCYVSDDKDATLANMESQGLIDAAVSSKVDFYLNQYQSLLKSRDEAQSKIDEITDKYHGSLESADTYATLLQEKNEEIEAKEAEIADLEENDPTNTALIDAAKEALAELKNEAEEISIKKTDAETLATQTANVTELDEQIKTIAGDGEGYIKVELNNGTYSAKATDKLIGEVKEDCYSEAKYANDIVNGNVSIATKISGQDAEIVLNGAVFKGSDNVFEINGLTFTALSVTQGDETVTVTTQDDVDGIYDMVKNFLKEYNSIINEMDKLYNADSAKGYEPLTDDEKESMSESEIEKYEQKIKDALLRRDSNLSSISSTLKEVMSSGYEVDGKTMYLSNFGINTLGYFNAADNEKNAYHIDGDEDDADTSGNADVLRSMIANDSNTVISFFSTLSKNLYSKMDGLSKSVEGYRSFGSFYDDKKMKEDYDDYTTKIAELEEKLNDYEDKWYSKFAAMETALAKLQDNASAVTSLLGG